MKLTIKEEDYLETIYRLSQESDSVGITDVARERGVTLPTVISAVSKLKESGLIKQRHYGKLYLKAAGRKKAEEIYKTHRAIKLFLTDVLQLPVELSESEACCLEHVMSPETIKRLAGLMDTIQNCPYSDLTLKDKCVNLLSRNSQSKKGKAAEKAMSLNELKPGQTATVTSVAGSGSIRRRLMDLGIRSGEKVKMVKFAPLRDPIEISLGNGHLSIRRSEASLIEVKI
ncbi:MAG: metal-dependent transcriptional regulator [Candidatus Zixiibacteriota bacterium]|nr:MAG: metal-dependent transcriptional regulator [candidate division Zixibacteria bacterium]